MPELRTIAERKSHPSVHVALAIVTLISTTWVGAQHLKGQSISSLSDLFAGLFYSIPLLVILGIHESGHFLLARVHRISVTPPFFIPLPFGLGTLGALIQVRSPAMDRRSLFDMAIAGPLAGFITAIPILLIGLPGSLIIHPDTPEPFMVGSFWQQTPASGSILLYFFASIVYGDSIQFGDILKLSPMALAGWIGIWVTAFNLLPIGQLDGGHIVQGMFGSKWSLFITRLLMFILLCLSIFIWTGFFVWLIILYIIARQTVPPVDDVTPINKWRMLLGWFALSLIFLIFIPMPNLP